MKSPIYLTVVYLWLQANLHAEPPLQVFILAGQSNMQGHAHVRTIEHLKLDPASQPLLELMTNSDGSARTCDRVWISSIGCAEHEQVGKLTVGFGESHNGPKIGPEFTFGLTMERQLPGKILLIKTSWGGKSLNTDFRPPSAGPYQFSPAQLANFEKQGKDLQVIKSEKLSATGASYRLMVEHVRLVLSDVRRIIPDYDSAQEVQLAGLIWFQGWNDLVDTSTYPNRDKPGGYDAYSEVMANFIRDVRKDLDAPQLPVVIGVLGVGGPVEQFSPEEQRFKAAHQNFRLAMAAPADLPEFKGNVDALWTEEFWDKELSLAKSKQEKTKQQAKKQATEGKLSPKEEKELADRLLTEQLSDRERLVIEKGISNFEFHYLGSAKILGGIGQGLAQSMIELKGLSKTN